MVSVRDPLYGYLELSDEEKAVLDSPQMQRLRRVRQTSLSSLVYPGATHSRFTHSLGVMHIAGRIAESMGVGEEEGEARRTDARLRARPLLPHV